MKTFTVSENVKKGFSLTFNPEGPNEILGVQVGQSILRDLRKDYEKGKSNPTLNWVDVVPDGALLRLVKEQNVRDRRALVRVETPPGVGGTVKLVANTFTETVDEKRGYVKREANAFPPAGVTLIAEKPASGPWGPEFLVSMMPGSSFRIVRTGRLYDSHEKRHAAPEMVVAWSGRWDHRAELDHFRNPDPERFAQFRSGKLRKTDFARNEWDSFRYRENPMWFWGLASRKIRQGDV